MGERIVGRCQLGLTELETRFNLFWGVILEILLEKSIPQKGKEVLLCHGRVELSKEIKDKGKEVWEFLEVWGKLVEREEEEWASLIFRGYEIVEIVF